MKTEGSAFSCVLFPFYFCLSTCAVVVWLALDWWIALPAAKPSHYVGRQTCARCHATQTERWKGSDHDLAMDLATPEFVLGDFDNAHLEHYGVTSTMYRRGDEFFVKTDGPDGKLAEFRVKYVIGVRPLQQYLTELDRGRVQVLPVSWDTQGKRWFFVSPDEPFGPGDPLHWTGSAQNWNHMCADCHTTNFAKNYDVGTDTHHYSFSEIDVSCEACHGPGSLHVELAESHSIFWDRRHGYGLVNLKDEDSKTELETCAPCHAHRQRVYPGFRPGREFLDYYGLSLLEDHLYHADGQINEEVYVYGSFTQSLMYRKGVRCTDCHDPHTTRLKFQGNRMCGQCHMPSKYDGPYHHHHQFGSKGAQCVACHMPAKKYMVVDPRPDHSLRVPRPDLTVSIGIHNACNDCHTKQEETPQWAAEKIVEWYGPQRASDPHYGEILYAGRRGVVGQAFQPADWPGQARKPAPHSAADVQGQLIELARNKDVGPIVRATAVSLLATRYNSPESQAAVQDALTAPEALSRAAALRAYDGWRVTSPNQAAQLRQRLVPLLNDPVRLVRVEAARLLAQVRPTILDDQQLAALDRALEEFKTGLLDNADQSGSHMSLGILYDNLGQTKAAIDAYRTAIRLDPEVAGPRSNLVEVLERLGKKDEVKKLRTQEAELLARDARLLPNNAPIHYRLGLVQYLLGREDEALRALSKAGELEPTSTEFLTALTLLYEKQQRWNLAMDAAKRLIRLEPHNEMFRQMLWNIQQGASRAARPIGPQLPPESQ